MGTVSYLLPGQDLLNLYFCDENFSKLVDSGCVLYVDNCLCLNQPQYIESDEFGFCHLSKYASLHIEECCFLFDQKEVQLYNEGELQEANKGICFAFENDSFSYYQRKIKIKEFSDKERCFDEKNPQNAELSKSIGRASQRAEGFRNYPGTLAETLIMHMKNRRLSVEKLSELSLVSVRTIQRLRTEEEYQTTKQTIIAICVGLQLPPFDAEDLLRKAGLMLNPTQTLDNAYKCILESCGKNSILVVNEILKAYNFPQLGYENA